MGLVSPWMKMSPDQQMQLAYAQRLQQQQMLAQSQEMGQAAQSTRDAFNYHPTASPTALPQEQPVQNAQIDPTTQQLPEQVPMAALANQKNVSKFKFGSKK